MIYGFLFAKKSVKYRNVFYLNAFMNANIDFLLSRQSNPNLTEPAPSDEELTQILQAAMSVPDHGALVPYQFTVVKENARQRLADIFVASIKANGGDEAKLAKAAKMPFRSPMMIIVSTKYQSHPKVPESEQLVTAGCAVHAMQMATLAMGYSGMWRTGDLAFCDIVKEELAIDINEDIVGFLYVGSQAKVLPQKQRKSYQEVTRFLSE